MPRHIIPDGLGAYRTAFLVYVAFSMWHVVLCAFYSMQYHTYYVDAFDINLRKKFNILIPVSAILDIFFVFTMPMLVISIVIFV